MPPVQNMVRFTQDWQLRVADYGTFPPLGLLYIATYLKKNMPHAEIDILDCPSHKYTYQQIEKILDDFCPDLVGITAYTLCLVDMLKVAGIVKSINKDTHICIGGPHNHNFASDTLEYPEVDSIVVGEGEIAFCELARRLENREPLDGIEGLYLRKDSSRKIFAKTIIKDIDSLPVFDIGFLDRDIYKSRVGKFSNIITLLSSRGCPYNCTFCDSPYKEFRSRNEDSIIDEIKLRLGEGFKEIFFYDDTFNITPERIIKLCRKIIEGDINFIWSFRGRLNSVNFDMLEVAKRAGCERIHFGVETASDEGLREIKKGITIEQAGRVLRWCRQLKIKTIADFIIGFPFEKCKEDIIKNIKRLISLSPDYAQFNILQPFPGTEIYSQGIKKGVIDPSEWRNFVKSPRADFQPPLWTEYLNKKELADLYYFAYRKFYLNPLRILNKVTSIRTTHELKMTFDGGVKLLFKK